MAANAAVDLTTIATLKARLGLSGVVVPDFDAAELQRLVTEASQRMHTEIGGNIIFGTRVDTKDANGGRRLYLDDATPPSGEDLWTCTVTSVVCDGVTIPASTAGSDGWKVTNGSRIDLVGNTYRFTRGAGGSVTAGAYYGRVIPPVDVVITYSAGFRVSPWSIPQDIEGAVCELAALRWKERERIGQTTKSVSGEVVSFQGSNVWSTFLAVAAAYHRVVVA
jgi:hypothetical protein